MTEPQRKSADKGKGGELLTLTQVSERTGISMPTLQKYKKKFSDRIPSKGKGRTQRYPEEALPIFEDLRKESSARRGRPRKEGAAAKPARSKASRRSKSTRKPAAAPRRGASAAKASAAKTRAAKARAAKAPEGEGQEVLTLTDISKRTGISYPTLMRYVRAHLASIPHSGEGRKRRFPPEAVAAFQKLYAGPRGGARPATAKAKRAARAAKAPKAARAPKARRTRTAAAAKPASKAKRSVRKTRAATKRKAATTRRGARQAASGVDVVKVLQRLEVRLKALEKELKKPIKLEVRR